MFRVWMAAFLVAAALVSSPALAQSCHEPVRPGNEGVTAGVRLAAGASENVHDAGTWERLTLEGEWRTGGWAVRLQQPLLHLERSGYREVGVGDTLVGSSVLLQERVAASATFTMLNLTLPTGDEEAELGMGHPMLMAGLAHERRLGSVVVTVEAGGASVVHLHPEEEEAEPASLPKHAPTSPVHAHGGGFAPLVAPMNDQEVWYATRITHGLGPAVELGVAAAGATPVGAEEGTSRLEVGPSLQGDASGMTWWVAAAFPVVSRVMDWRAELGLRWSLGEGPASARCRCDGMAE